MPSLFQQHQARWRACTACALCEGRRKVVLFRGRIPCDLLFIGEAPGASEDSIGEPFTGPAGHLLDSIIAQAVPDNIRFALTNLVSCFPREQKKTDNHQPPDEAIKACAPRLTEFVVLARPRLLVNVGGLPRDWLDPKRVSLRAKPLYPFAADIPQVSIVHPSHILQSNIAMRSLAIRKAVVTVAKAVQEYL